MTSKEQVLKHLDELDKKVDTRIKGLEAEKEELRRTDNEIIAKIQGEIDRLKTMEKFKAAYDSLKEIVGPVVEEMLKSHKLPVGSNPTPGGTVHTTLTDVKHVIRVAPPEDRPVEIDTTTNRGKILYLGSKGFFDDWRKAGEVLDEMERLRGWSMNDKVCMMELANITGLGYLRRVKRDNQYAYRTPEEGVKFLT